MKDYLNLYWLIPGVPFLINLLVVVFTAAAPGRVGSIAAGFNEPMFLVTPAFGVLVLISLLLMRILDRPLLNRINFARTLTFALLDLIAPVLFFVMAMILSGFTR